MPQDAANPSVPFVGRELELRHLHDALQAAIRDKKPRFILIQGDYGVGKTALVDQFLAEVCRQNPSVLIGRSKCSMETELNGLVPFSQVLDSLAGGGPRQVVPVQLREFIKEVAPAWLDIVTLGITSAVVTTVEEGGKLLARSTFSQDNVFVQYTNILGKLAAKRPVVAFVDDLHWADASSLSLLFYLARNLEKRPVVFLCAYRPVAAIERGANAARFRDVRANLIRHGVRELELSEGLDVSHYVTQRYPLNRLPARLIEQVQQLTDGHALFVSELFSLWQETGVIVETPQSDGRLMWDVAQQAEVSYAIPKTVSEVLGERLRLMEDDLCEILTCASVEGEDFTAQVITCVRHLDEDQAYESLEKLERSYRMIREQGSKEVGALAIDFYRFAHRFFREYIFGQLSAGRRRVMHRKVAECLERLYSDRDQVAGQLAVHFREANEPMKATRYALMAARFEGTRFAWAEAEQWCEWGLQLVDRMSTTPESLLMRFDLLEQAADSYYQVSEYRQAEQMYHRALAMAQELGVAITRVVALYAKLADVSEYEGQRGRSMAELERALQLLEEHKIPFGELACEVIADHAFMHDRLGNTSLAVESLNNVLERAKDLPQTVSLEAILANIHNYLGIVTGGLGKCEAAVASYKNALELAERQGNKRLQATCWLNMADELVKIGDLGQSEACVSRGLEVARQMGDHDSESYALATRGKLSLARMKPVDAVRELTEAIALSDRLGSLWNMAYMRADLALAHLMLSDVKIARQEAQCAVANTDEGVHAHDVGYVLEVLAQVECAEGDWQSAEQHFSQAIAIHIEQGYAYYEAQARYHFAQALLRRGEPHTAHDQLQAALATSQKVGLHHWVDKATTLLDECQTGKGSAV